MAIATENLEYFTKLGAKMNLSRPLHSVYTHVNECWIPVNPQLMALVRSNLKNGAYRDRDSLLKDLKSDISLFAYCIRELKKLLDQRSDGQDNVNPATLLREAPLEDLEEILNREPDTISIHRLTETGDLQARRLQFALASAHVAQTVSAKYEIDSDTVYACAILRQLGITLIAWNYPHLYQRVANSMKPGDSIERGLNRVLGFSPLLLGTVIARQWGLSTEVRVGMGDQAARSALPADSPALQTGELLEKICKIGETFARISDSGSNPTESTEWENARSDITDCLGPGGLRIIFEQLEIVCQAYARIMPELFRRPEGAPTKRPMQGKELFENNLYIRHCATEVQSGLRALYETIEPGHVEKEIVDRLIKEIVPKAGFVRGCVYMFDPDSGSLAPRLAIGDTKLSSCRERKCFSNEDGQDSVLAAFRCQTPIMDNKVRAGGELSCMISGALGNVQKVGVLYLEVAPDLMKQEAFNPLITFRAIRQALLDCMNIW